MDAALVVVFRNYAASTSGRPAAVGTGHPSAAGRIWSYRRT